MDGWNVDSKQGPVGRVCNMNNVTKVKAMAVFAVAVMALANLTILTYDNSDARVSQEEVLAYADLQGVDIESMSESQLQDFINKAILEIENLTYATGMSYAEYIHAKANEAAETAIAVDSQAEKLYESYADRLNAAVQDIASVKELFRSIARDPDAYFHLREAKDILINYVNDIYSDENIDAAKKAAREYYSAFMECVDKYYDKVPQFLRPYVDKMIQVVKEFYVNIENYNYVMLRESIISEIESPTIEKIISEKFLEIAAEIENEAAKISALIYDPEAKAAFMSGVQEVVDALYGVADSLHAFEVAVQNVTINAIETMESIRAFINNLFDLDINALKESLPAKVQTVLSPVFNLAEKYANMFKGSVVSTYASKLAQNYSNKLVDQAEVLVEKITVNDIEQLLLDFVDQAEVAAKDIQAQAVQMYNQQSAQYQQEADDIQTWVDDGGVEKICLALGQGVQKAYALVDEMQAIADDPDTLINITQIRDKIIATIEDVYSEESIEELKAELKELYEAIETAYQKYYDKFPAWMAEILEEVMDEIYDIYSAIEGYNFGLLKAQIENLVYSYAAAITTYIANEYAQSAAELQELLDSVMRLVVKDGPIYQALMNLATRVVASLQQSAVEMKELAQAVEEIDIAAIADALRAEIRSWFEISRDDYKVALEFCLAEVALVEKYTSFIELESFDKLLQTATKDINWALRYLYVFSDEQLQKAINTVKTDLQNLYSAYNAIYSDIEQRVLKAIADDYKFIFSEGFKTFLYIEGQRVALGVSTVVLAAKFIWDIFNPDEPEQFVALA